MTDLAVHAPADQRVAVVAAECRLPGAPDVEAFWELLVTGRDAVTRELRPAPACRGSGGHTAVLTARGRLDRIDEFDAAFFGYSPADARITDPQIRLLLEVGYHAFEASGRIGRGDRVGVFASCGISTYLLNNLLPGRQDLPAWGEIYPLNDKDFAATRLAYALGATGPAVSVQTACSSSLVAVHMACQSLLVGECDAALVAAVGIHVPQDDAEPYRSEGILSADGYCRAFDAAATGTTFGNGVVAILLRRLEDAVTDDDEVLATILGTAINNDGRRKPGYLAPSVDGQRECILAALDMADVGPDDVGLVEAHGTGTLLGDPVELAALWEAWQARGTSGRRCAIGSVKTNVGHLSEAAGLAGLLKAVLSVQRAAIPPSLHFTVGNTAFDWAAAPFFVPVQSLPWDGDIRVAGVTSLGMGGTNAHVIVASHAQPPDRAAATSVPRGSVTLRLSAASRRSLAALADSARILLETDAPLGQAIAETLDLERPDMAYRLAVTAPSPDLLAGELRWAAAGIQPAPVSIPGVVVLAFGGQANLDIPAVRALYERTDFAGHVRRSLAVLDDSLAQSLHAVLTVPGAAPLARQTDVAQSLLFTVQSYLTDHLLAAGIEPRVVTGHSAGELAAAYAAGMIGLSEAMWLAGRRGTAMEQLAEKGAIASVSASAAVVRGMLDEDVFIAADNSAGLCTIAGTTPAITRALATLRRDGVRARRLDVERAFHTPAMARAATAVAGIVSQVTFAPGHTTMVSTVTGERVDGRTVGSPSYWHDQILGQVAFRSAMNAIDATVDGPHVWIEVGLSPALRYFLDDERLPNTRGSLAAVPAVIDPAGDCVLGRVLGQCWALGVSPRTADKHGARPSRRIRLPYPFDRQRYWIDPPSVAAPSAGMDPVTGVPPGPPGDDQVLEAVMEAWRTVLGVASIQPGDNYFDLGGQSLTAIAMVEEISRVVPSASLPSLRELLSDPTPEGMTRMIASRLDRP